VIVARSLAFSVFLIGSEKIQRSEAMNIARRGIETRNALFLIDFTPTPLPDDESFCF
jgi:hypothetical protein